MKHLDLFSGIGGFALATESVWPDIEHTFVEYDPFCQAILKKHWPRAEIHGDIREFIANTKKAKCEQPRRTRKRRERFTDNDCFILTGGFPCQPFSQAGQRKGTADDRYLWPAMYDAIQLFRPTWVVAENVAGLVTWDDGVVLETVCADLEKEGYEVQPFIIPACAVGAPHRRDRVWIIGHTKYDGQHGSENGEGSIEGSDGDASRENKDGEFTRSALARNIIENPKRKRARRGMENSGQILECKSTKVENARSSWASDWPEVATRLCTLDDGIPNGLVRPRGWRNAALKAAGNAIVPQVAVQIMEGIKNS